MEETQSPFNYNKTDWKSLETKLKDYLRDLINPEHISRRPRLIREANRVSVLTGNIRVDTPKETLPPQQKMVE